MGRGGGEEAKQNKIKNTHNIVSHSYEKESQERALKKKQGRRKWNVLKNIRKEKEKEQSQAYKRKKSKV